MLRLRSVVASGVLSMHPSPFEPPVLDHHRLLSRIDHRRVFGDVTGSVIGRQALSLKREVWKVPGYGLWFAVDGTHSRPEGRGCLRDAGGPPQLLLQERGSAHQLLLSANLFQATCSPITDYHNGLSGCNGARIFHCSYLNICSPACLLLLAHCSLLTAVYHCSAMPLNFSVFGMAKDPGQSSQGL